jgi:hypothetical protein
MIVLLMFNILLANHHHVSHIPLGLAHQASLRFFGGWFGDNREKSGVRQRSHKRVFNGGVQNEQKLAQAKIHTHVFIFNLYMAAILIFDP